MSMSKIHPRSTLMPPSRHRHSTSRNVSPSEWPSTRPRERSLEPVTPALLVKSLGQDPAQPVAFVTVLPPAPQGSHHMSPVTIRTSTLHSTSPGSDYFRTYSPSRTHSQVSRTWVNFSPGSPTTPRLPVRPAALADPASLPERPSRPRDRTPSRSPLPPAHGPEGYSRASQAS